MDARQDALLVEFDSYFFPVLGRTARWHAFREIAKRLILIENPIIVETGCVRVRDNWIGDGQSTRIWNWFADKIEAGVQSIDISPEACVLAMELCPFVHVSCDDSLSLLSRHAKIGLLSDVDLLYLDSYDLTPDNPNSELHHAGELAAAYRFLPSGAWIAIDDCHTDTEGKHAMVKQFFDKTKISPVVSGYITIWEKP